MRRSRNFNNISLALILVSLCAPCHSANEPVGVSEPVPGSTIALPQSTASIYLQQTEEKMRSGDYIGAISIAGKAVEVHNTSALLWQRLGMCYQIMEEFQKSISAYQKAYNLDPKGQKETLFYMAVVHEKLHQESLAYDKYMEYLQVDPNGKYFLAAKEKIREFNQMHTTGCGSMVQNLIEMAEKKPIPGPSTYKLHALRTHAHQPNSAIGSRNTLLKADGKGNDTLIATATDESLKGISLADAERYWGPAQGLTYQEDYVRGQDHQVPTDKQWLWFKEAAGAIFTRFNLTTDKKDSVLIEAFFMRESNSASAMSAKLAKLRVILMGMGTTSWIDTTAVKEHRSP